MKTLNRSWMALAAVTLTLTASAADKSKKPNQKMDPAMEQAMQMSMPGDNHKLLNPLVGTFTTVVKGWMKPGDQPKESKGTSVNDWILNGRFLQQSFSGDWEGQTFEGKGFTGYDNLKKQFTNIWLDNMSTGMMSSTGDYDPSTKSFTYTGTFSCPMTGETDKWVRSELKIIDNDNHTYKSFFKDAAGQEFKAMEITYKRVK